MSSNTGQRRYGDHIQEETRQQRQRQRHEKLQEAVDEANKKLTSGELAEVGRRIRDGLVPLIKQLDTHQPWAEYHREFRSDPDAEWHWSDLKRFLDNPNEFITKVEDAPRHNTSELISTSNGRPTQQKNAEIVIRRALQSLESVTAYHDVIHSELTDSADAVGFNRKLGEHMQQWDHDFGDPVEATTRKLGELKHFFTGGTGGGKSAGASGQMLDYYLASVFDGRDYKCLDPVGLSSENICAYDIPQQDGDLRNALKEHGRPPSWDEAADYLIEEYGSIEEAPEDLQRLVEFEPKAEYYVPLSPDLEDFELPYDTAEDEPVPKPFTIPAADCPEELYVAVLEARVSNKELDTIREAYREVDNRIDDWSLGDLKRMIKGRPDISEDNREQAIRVIGNLQDLGFIRTRSDEHALDDDAWRQLFRSTDVVTAFNQVVVRTDVGRMFIVAYLLDQIWRRRIRSHGNPSLVTWLRELWEIAPHREHRRKEDDVVQNIMEFIISRLTKMQRKPRDINQHIIADTQDYTDPERSVRTRFNRYVVFGGSDDVLKDIFSAAGVNGWKSLKSSLTGKPGHAGIVGACDAAVGDPDLYGVSPVHLTPPLWHHYDKNKITSGWKRRTAILDNEELRSVANEWDIEPPADQAPPKPTNSEDKDGGGESTADGEDDSGDHIPEPDPEDRLSQKELAKLQARQLRSETHLSYEKIAERIENNPKTGESWSKGAVRNWVKHIDKGSGEAELELDLDIETPDAAAD